MSPCGLATNTVRIGDRKVERLQGIDISVFNGQGEFLQHIRVNYLHHYFTIGVTLCRVER